MTLSSLLKVVSIASLSAAMSFASACAQTDDSQQQLRENPVIDTLTVAVVHIPSYVDLEANSIDMNGADWSGLGDKFSSASDSLVAVVFIGDSHLQADMGTAVTRHRLANKYGTGGRGLAVPFRLAGTNQPTDYTITMDSPVSGSRLLKKPWPTHMGFTGIGVSPVGSEFSATINNSQPFDSVEVFFTGDWLAVNDSLLTARTARSPLRMGLKESSTEHTLSLVGDPSAAIHGFNLVNGDRGLLTHVIGNNGATYGTYNELDSFPENIARLDPALIIISLGTNEAFGKVSDQEMADAIHTMVEGLRKSAPAAKLLLTTPAECQRRLRSRRRRRAGSYQVNANVKRLRNAIVVYGRNNGIPVYDFYQVAGGDGSSAKWLNDSLLNKDRIHLTRAGYTLQGTLLTNALLQAVESGDNLQ